MRYTTAPHGRALTTQVRLPEPHQDFMITQNGIVKSTTLHGAPQPFYNPIDQQVYMQFPNDKKPSLLSNLILETFDPLKNVTKGHWSFDLDYVSVVFLDGNEANIILDNLVWYLRFRDSNWTCAGFTARDIQAPENHAFKANIEYCHSQNPAFHVYTYKEVH